MSSHPTAGEALGGDMPRVRLDRANVWGQKRREAPALSAMRLPTLKTKSLELGRWRLDGL